MTRCLSLLAALAAFLALPPATASPVQGVVAPPVAARAFAVIDVQSGQLLASGSETDPLEPASLTKLMTAYLTFEALQAKRLDEAQAVPVSARARDAAGARMVLEAGKEAPVQELLRGLIVHAANDAAVALAEAVAGSEEAFVERMNAQAAKLGLAETRFANASGLPAPGHVASARDLAKLAAALVAAYPERLATFAQKEFSWNGLVHNNRNRLLWIDPSVDGLATGFTESSGYGIAASARRGERRVVAVVLGAQTEALRTSETLKLLNFAYQAYETRRVYKAGQSVGTREIFKGTQAHLSIGFDRDVWITLPRSRFTGLQAVLETRRPFVAPYARGQGAGTVRLVRENAPIAEFPVVALEDVPVAGFLSRGYDTLRLLLAR